MPDTIQKRRVTTSRAPQAADIYAGEKLRKLREGRRMTLAQLGDMLGMSHQQVQKYETGTNRMSVGIIDNISTVLNISPLYFFDKGEAHDPTAMLINVQANTDRAVRMMDDVILALTNTQTTLRNITEE